jgi:hypothetical protein
MKRLWYVDILKGETFLVRAVNVFDGVETEDAVEAQANTLAGLEAILRRLKPFARLPRRYMEINGLGSLLRIASLPQSPSGELVAHALEDLGSARPPVLITPFLTRDEISWCLSRKDRAPEPGKE